ncbi:hypothetical protein GM418_10325 [Maribellus comscasis]|uniref:Guanylate cyclase domain-containing protein n=1 Tax=Maribellus comscasis TaxID=2681766 RepID=A0A6I6JSI3_9BACT|nr:adenylate/guanylate cyclase domain-containing protein [Maribellus comscasis]QGY44038.1 hypothetical protein GM418_10325 [Maribellus comscasis]
MSLKPKLNIGPKLKYKLGFLLFSLVYWNIVVRIAILLRMLGTPTDDFREVFSKGMSFFVDEVAASSIIISLFALFTWTTFYFIYPKIIDKFQLRKLTIFVIFFDIIIFFFIGVLLGIVHYNVDKDYVFWDSLSKLNKFLFNSTTLFFLIVILIASYVYQLIYTIVHQNSGSPIAKIMMGYYQKPREENLIFLFLDLQSSTKFAEILGHENYSYFIQDCFRFLTNPIIVSRGRVYQFVGDEVVVTWNANKPESCKRAVDFFYLFEEELEKQKEYFEKKYGLMPVFTASINTGKVMATEVGEIKKEIAFHGDVLNTAARIQKQCKRYRKNILVTRDFASQLISAKTEYRLNYVDIVKFLGKDRIVKIYEVCREQQ